MKGEAGDETWVVTISRNWKPKILRSRFVWKKKNDRNGIALSFSACRFTIRYVVGFF